MGGHGSGGRNRKSRRQHELQGTYKPARHGAAGGPVVAVIEPPTHLGAAEQACWRSLGPRGLNPLGRTLCELLCVHLEQHRRLSAALAVALEGGQVGTAALQRSLRQEAAAVKSLKNGLDLAWRDGETVAPVEDAFAEFDQQPNPLDRFLKPVSRWAGEFKEHSGTHRTR